MVVCHQTRNLFFWVLVTFLKLQSANKLYTHFKQFLPLWSQFPSIFLVLLLTSKHLILPPPTKTFSHMIQISLLQPPIPPFLAFTEDAWPSAGSHKMVALLCSGHRGGCVAVSSSAAACIRHCPEMEAHVYSRAVVSYKVLAIRILFSFLASALLYSTQSVFLWDYHFVMISCLN